MIQLPAVNHFWLRLRARPGLFIDRLARDGIDCGLRTAEADLHAGSIPRFPKIPDLGDLTLFVLPETHKGKPRLAPCVLLFEQRPKLRDDRNRSRVIVLGLARAQIDRIPEKVYLFPSER